MGTLFNTCQYTPLAEDCAAPEGVRTPEEFAVLLAAALSASGYFRAVLVPQDAAPTAPTPTATVLLQSADGLETGSVLVIRATDGTYTIAGTLASSAPSACNATTGVTQPCDCPCLVPIAFATPLYTALMTAVPGADFQPAPCPYCSAVTGACERVPAAMYTAVVSTPCPAATVLRVVARALRFDAPAPSGTSPVAGRRDGALLAIGPAPGLLNAVVVALVVPNTPWAPLGAPIVPTQGSAAWAGFQAAVRLAGCTPCPARRCQ
jgi:hypothetical protein